MSNFKVVRLRWWNKPVKLAKRTENGFEFIGWVWNQRAYLVRNIHHGWIAFVDDQDEEKLNKWFCQHCGASLFGTARASLEKEYLEVGTNSIKR